MAAEYSCILKEPLGGGGERRGGGVGRLIERGGVGGPDGKKSPDF